MLFLYVIHQVTQVSRREEKSPLDQEKQDLIRYTLLLAVLAMFFALAVAGWHWWQQT